MNRHRQDNRSNPVRAGVVLALAALAPGIQAADVSIQPAAGDGFVVRGAAAERLRVQEDGAVTLPAVPGAAAQPNALCISAAGLLGPCAGGGGNYDAGDGLDLAGSTFSITPGYRLPQTCTTAQIAQWNGTAWECATPAGGGGLPTCEDGQFIRVLNGTLQCGTLPSTVTTLDDPDIVNAGEYASIAIGADGLPVIAYAFHQNSVKLAKCNDASCSSFGHAFVESEFWVGYFTSVAVGADGFPVISYYDAGSGARHLKVAKCVDAACAKPALINVVDGGGRYNSIAIGTDGFPVIGYYHDGLKVAKCTDAACASVATHTLDDGGPANDDVGQHTSIAVPADGLPVISYHDATNNRLKVAKCGDTGCATASLATFDYSGTYGSIAVPADGLPVISHYDAGNTALMVIKCADPACANPAFPTLIDGLSDDVGEYTSLAIGTDGFPVISYYDATDTSLKVAKCADAGCFPAPRTITTVDNTGDVGKWSSIAIGADGLPVIGYYDETNGALKVVKCSTASCRNP